jgi:hypothetical protein
MLISIHSEYYYSIDKRTSKRKVRTNPSEAFHLVLIITRALGKQMFRNPSSKKVSFELVFGLTWLKGIILHKI